jgi:putative transposase
VGVSPSGYYDWHRRLQDPGPRARQDQRLLGEIRRIHTQSGGAYGVPRIHAELQIACGFKVGTPVVEGEAPPPPTPPDPARMAKLGRRYATGFLG